MQLTSYALEAMGFHVSPDEPLLKAQFYRVDVFEAQGFFVDSDEKIIRNHTIDGNSFKVGVGNNLNDLCETMIGQEYTKDEDKWHIDNRSTPPYIMIVLGPTEEYTASSSRYKINDEDIITYDSFREARQHLEIKADATIPPLVAAIAVTFSDQSHPIRIIPRQSSVAGKTKDNKTVYDIQLKAEAHAYTSTHRDQNTLDGLISSSFDLLDKTNKNILKFYYKGINESDNLKSFLFLFLIIERAIRSEFKKIDHNALMKTYLDQLSGLEKYGLELFKFEHDNWKDLRTQLTWCAMHKWDHLSDTEIKEFEGLKKVRDGISHGSITDVAADMVRNAERLALTILKEVAP